MAFKVFPTFNVLRLFNENLQNLNVENLFMAQPLELQFNHKGASSRHKTRQAEILSK